MGWPVTPKKIHYVTSNSCRFDKRGFLRTDCLVAYPLTGSIPLVTINKKMVTCRHCSKKLDV